VVYNPAATSRREGSLRELEAELADLKRSITEVRHRSVVADAALGGLDKVFRRCHKLRSSRD
jgi:hypothetical protein